MGLTVWKLSDLNSLIQLTRASRQVLSQYWQPGPHPIRITFSPPTDYCIPDPGRNITYLVSNLLFHSCHPFHSTDMQGSVLFGLSQSYNLGSGDEGLTFELSHRLQRNSSTGSIWCIQHPIRRNPEWKKCPS